MKRLRPLDLIAMFSVLVLTLNEERNLPHCLASVSRCDDIVVLDSGSADRTAEIARAAGARVFVHPFVNFAQQRNHAHEHIPFRHPWVFHLDADEQLTPALFDECRQTSAASTNAPPLDGYLVAPRMMFRGRWIPRCTDFPAYQARFVAPARFRFVQAGHGQREAPGQKLGTLRENYLHDLSSETEDAWLAKHRRYAREEAAAIVADPVSSAHLFRTLFAGPALARRRALKRLSYALPARPAFRFVYQYLLRGGFLDGAPAWHYCRLLATYERFARDELRRLRRSALSR